MTSPFMDAYVQLLIKTCHKRGVHAMGGMAAQIPIKNDPAANEAALAKVSPAVTAPACILACKGLLLSTVLGLSAQAVTTSANCKQRAVFAVSTSD